MLYRKQVEHSGYPGFNWRIDIQLWHNYICQLPDPRFDGQYECGQVFHHRKEYKAHIQLPHTKEN